MRLIMVRHGETTEQHKNIMQGQINPSLNENGTKQAEKLAKNLINENIDRIYCSTLKRCRETIQPYLKLKDTPIIYTSKLMERNYGIFDGKPAKNFKDYLKENDLIGNFDFKLPKGESFTELQDRVYNYLKNKILKNQGNILVVTHNSVHIAICLYILNKTTKAYDEFHIGTTGLSEFNIEEKRTEIIKLNSTEHLS
ncbi:histidine phosphatase family protein [Candidatus Woesearchaeota archaeon]|nr:histidine phosphatase family protein [Candidatus Woesearchaeota archaeon]